MEFKLPLLCLSADRFGEGWGEDKKNHITFLIGIKSKRKKICDLEFN